MPEYVLKGWDDAGNFCAESSFDAWDDKEAEERAQKELTNGDFDRCYFVRLFKLEFIASFGERV